MKPISNDFKTEITEFGRQYKNIIEVYDNLLLGAENNNVLSTQNSLDIIAKVSEEDVGIELDDEQLFSIKLITKGELLSTLMKELDFESPINIDVGSIINYKFGLKVDDDYEFIDYGKYIIYKKEYNEVTKNYNYTAYDFMLKSMIMIGNEFSFSTNTPTGGQVLEKICDILTIDFDNSLEDENHKPTPYGMIKNLNYNINLFPIKESKITYRDLLNLLCQYFGVSMYVENNELKIKLLGTIKQVNSQWVVDTENPDIVDTLDETYFIDNNVTFKNIYGKINALLITGTDETKQKYVEDSQSITANGLTTFGIQKNIIINDDLIWISHGDDIANNIFDMINGVDFELYDLSTNGILYLDWLDYYNVLINGINYKCLLLNSEITIKSGISETIYTDLPEKNVGEYTTSDKSNDIIGDTIRARGNAYANGEKLVQESEIEGIFNNSYTISSKQGYSCNYINNHIDNEGSIISNKAIKIPKSGTAGYGLTNSDGTSIIRDWNNQCVTVNATGSTLFLGHQTTNDINVLNGKAAVESTGAIKATNGIYSIAAGSVGTNSNKTGTLMIKRATSSEAPNNGVVLEYATNANYAGQLYIGDNATQGVYYNGWSNGTRGSWKKLAFQDDTKSHICIGYYTSNKQINAEYVTPTLDGSRVVGNKLSLSGGKIKIGAGVSKVKISASAFLENVNSSRFGYIWMFVYKNNNSTAVASAIMSGVPNYYQTISITDIIVDVAQNDTLYLGFNNPNSSNPATIRNGINNTRLYVEVVE